MATWRKGLRWDKQAKGWRVVKTGRLLTPIGLKRRKTKAAKPPKPPKPRKPRRTKQQIAYDRMKSEIERMESELDDRYVVDSRIHKNKDGTIDAELRIKPKRGQKVNEAFDDMAELTEDLPKVWVSTGIRYFPREDEEIYVKFQGMSQVNTNFQRAEDKATRDINFETIQVIHENMRALGRRKPEQMFMHLHWNPQNRQPDRDPRSKGRPSRKRKR